MFPSSSSNGQWNSKFQTHFRVHLLNSPVLRLLLEVVPLEAALERVSSRLLLLSADPGSTHLGLLSFCTQLTVKQHPVHPRDL